MGRRNELPPEKRDEVAQRYVGGESIPALQLAMHRSAWMITRVLDEKDIPRRRPGRQAKILPGLELFMAQYGQAVVQPAEVARHYGVRRELARRSLNPNITRGGRKIKSV